ncbi:MAG: ribonuclease E inhibitor RraB [Desulfatibacillaceae bacterium]
MKEAVRAKLNAISEGQAGRLEGRYEEILKRHLLTNLETWRLLQRNGVDEYSEVRLNFFFYTSEEEAANALYDYLQSETEYDLEMEKKGLLKKTWRISGATQPTAISLIILNDWVRWMVSAGARHNCEFHGWGTGIA